MTFKLILLITISHGEKFRFPRFFIMIETRPDDLNTPFPIQTTPFH